MKILIVDEQPMFRRGLVSILTSNFNNVTIDEVSTNQEALFSIKRCIPQIVVVDINSKLENKLDFIIKTKKDYKNIKFVIFTSHIKKEEFTIATTIGVNGFILKDSSIEDFLYAINVINRDKTYIAPELIMKINRNYKNIETLSKREYDVVVEISKGNTNIEIANALFISEHTVKKHISNILSKLKLNNRTEIALYANDILLPASNFQLYEGYNS